MNISAKERESRGIRKLSNSTCIYFSINIHHRIIGWEGTPVGHVVQFLATGGSLEEAAMNQQHVGKKTICVSTFTRKKV